MVPELALTLLSRRREFCRICGVDEYGDPLRSGTVKLSKAS
jgi:hypothetical protein